MRSCQSSKLMLNIGLQSSLWAPELPEDVCAHYHLSIKLWCGLHLDHCKTAATHPALCIHAAWLTVACIAATLAVVAVASETSSHL